MITAKFTPNLKAIEDLNKAHPIALKQTVENLSTEIETAQVVPMKTGALKDSQSHGVIDGRGFISWNMPYARRLYFHPEYNFSTLEHANAKGLWCDYWLYQDGKQDVINAYGQFLKMNSKGVVK